MKDIIMKRILTICLLATLPYIATYGQESINKDVKVVSEYTPVVSEASKISLSPQIDDTTSQKPVFEYKVSSKKLEAEFVTQPISPASISKEKTFYAPTSLAKIGVGTYSTAFGELYYNILKSDKYAVALSFDHLSSIGNLQLSNDSLVKAPLHITNGALNVRRFFKRNTLSFDLNFNRTGIEYYGLQNLNSSTDYYLNHTSNLTTSGVLLEGDKIQRHSVVDATIGYAKTGGDEKDDSYNGSFRFSNYGNKIGVTENTILLDAKYKHFVESFYIEGLGNIESNVVSTPSNNNTLYYFLPANRTTVAIMPRIGFIFSHADIQVGLNIISQVGDNLDKGAYIGPHLLAKANLAEGIISVFGGISSKLNTNSYRSIAYENKYIAPDLNVKSSFTGINLFGGVKGNFSSKTSFLAQVDYSSFTNEHFFVNKMYRTTDPTNTALVQKYDYSNKFDVVYDDGKLLTVSGEFIVKPNELFDIVLSGKYYSWDLSTQLKAWHKPEMELGIKSVLKPAEGWKIQAQLLSIGKRYAYDATTLGPKELKSIWDLSINAEYNYNQQWMFFGGVYNLLANKYYQWNEYPTHGVNIRVGIGYTF